MKLTKVQDRFIKNKNMGFSLMKGKSLTGKTLTALHRVINLENNYCIYNNDKILYISLEHDKARENERLYKNISKKEEFYSLFSLNEKRVSFNSIRGLIEKYSNKYLKYKNKNLKLISFEKGIEFLKHEEFIKILNEFLKKSKVLKRISIEELYDEILWIKSCNFSKEEYEITERKARKFRCVKNSFTRKAIYTLMEVYTNLLRNYESYDKYDETIFAIKYSKIINDKYTHVVLDNVEALTKGEIEFAKSVYSNNAHSSFAFILNNEIKNSYNCWMIKGRRLKTLGADFKGKSFSLKKEFNKEEKLNNIIENKFIDKFEYVNLKYKNIVDFNLDNGSSKKEIYLEDNIVFSEDELIDVNVYSDIAAGTPIEMNDEVIEKFPLPKSWIERGKDTFILHVKGDSMIEKNINDGDLVVIKKQNTALNNEIVAASLNGEATLKTLKLNGDSPMLVPANPKYSEIYLEGKEVSILGVAIGIIKNKLN